MKRSEKIIQVGNDGQRFVIHAHVENHENLHSGVSLSFTSTYDDSRNPNEHRRLFQQHFPTQADFNRFVDFLVTQKK